MTTQLPIAALIESEVADFFAGFVEVHTELGGPNTVEEAQTQLTERICALLAAYEQEPVSFDELRDAVAEVTGGRPMEWREGDSKGHQVVPFINFNSLARIVDKFRTHPAPSIPTVPEDMTAEMMRAVQLNSELGAYAAANLSGAYNLFAEFWKVACRAAMLQGEPDGWIPVSERLPDPGSEQRVCVYTPTPHEDVRYRFVPASLFKAVCRDATHWQYMSAPKGSS